MEKRVEELINAESEMESNDSKYTKGIWSQSSESDSDRVGSSDRLNHSKLFIDGGNFPKLLTFYWILFIIFFSFNVSYYIGPRVLSPAFATYFVEESPETSWSNISSTVVNLFDNFVPDSSDRLAELFPNVTADGSRFHWYYGILCSKKRCVDPDKWHENILLAMIALKAAQEGEVADMHDYLSKVSTTFSGVREEAMDKVVELERYQRDHDDTAARVVKEMNRTMDITRGFVEMGFWLPNAIVIIFFLKSLCASTSDKAEEAAFACIFCLMISTILTGFGLVKPAYPGVLKENAIMIKKGGLMIQLIVLVILQLIYIISTVVYALVFYENEKKKYKIKKNGRKSNLT